MSGLTKLITKSQQFDVGKADYTVDIGKISYNKDARLMLPKDDLGQLQPLKITDWAMGQVCTKLGGLPKSYLMRCPEWLRADQLNYWQQNKQVGVTKHNEEGGRMSDKWMVRTHDDRVRAALTDKYTPISNTEILEAVYDLARESDLHGKLIRPYVTADRLDMKMIVDYRDDGGYGIGAYVGNGEIGNRVVTVNGLVQRNGCTNSIIVADSGFSRRHIYTTPETLRTLLLAAIAEAFKISAHTFDNIMLAERQKLPSLSDVVKSIRKDHRLSDNVHDAIIGGSENKSTVMGVVNGLSYAAHAVPDLDQDDRIKLETMAGAILADPEDLFGFAARMEVSVEVENG